MDKTPYALKGQPVMDIKSGKIIAILGPTASGKSDIAIRLARQFNGEIISADSRQIYRGMDLGTGKVTKKEQRLARHWMLDIVNPDTKYNAAKFKKQSEKIIIDILERGKLPIICGGTGFWIKALVDNVAFPEVKPDWELRKKLEKKSVEVLFKMILKLDPARAKTIEPQNKVRLIRAIEICKAIGKVPALTAEGSTFGAPKVEPSRCAFLQIGITWPKNVLQKRIKIRLEKRLKQGMIKEVKDLHFKQKISWRRLESFGLEYRWLALYLQNKIAREEMEEKLYFDIIHYAKRQMTWFSAQGRSASGGQKYPRIKWTKNYSVIQKEIKIFLKK
jgi:tRNA dimethylallyltransferase